MKYLLDLPGTESRIKLARALPYLKISTDNAHLLCSELVRANGNRFKNGTFLFSHWKNQKNVIIAYSKLNITMSFKIYFYFTF